MDRSRLRSQKIAEEFAQKGMRGVDDLLVGLVAEHQSERLQPFQKPNQSVIVEADECAGHLAADCTIQPSNSTFTPRGNSDRRARRSRSTGVSALAYCSRM